MRRPRPIGGPLRDPNDPNHKDLKHPANIALGGLALAFLLWELLGAFVGSIFSVIVTFSEYVWAAEDWGGWPVQIVVVILCLVLLTHLAFGVPR